MNTATTIETRVGHTGPISTSLHPGWRMPIYIGSDGRHRLLLTTAAAMVGWIDEPAAALATWTASARGFTPKPAAIQFTSDGTPLVCRDVLAAVAADLRSNAERLALSAAPESAVLMDDLIARLASLDASSSN